MEGRWCECVCWVGWRDGDGARGKLDPPGMVEGGTAGGEGGCSRMVGIEVLDVGETEVSAG